jgi:acetyl-CoA synthetase
MGASRLTPPTVISRLRDARDQESWTPDPAYSMVQDALFDQDPGDVAILRSGVHQPDEVTFGEVQDAARRIAGALAARGVRPGDRVAMYLDPSLAAAEVVCGVLTAGAVILPIPKLLGGQSVAHRLLDAKACILVTDATGLGRLLESGAVPAAVTVLTVDASWTCSTRRPVPSRSGRTCRPATSLHS